MKSFTRILVVLMLMFVTAHIAHAAMHMMILDSKGHQVNAKDLEVPAALLPQVSISTGNALSPDVYVQGLMPRTPAGSSISYAGPVTIFITWVGKGRALETTITPEETAPTDLWWFASSSDDSSPKFYRYLGAMRLPGDYTIETRVPYTVGGERITFVFTEDMTVAPFTYIPLFCRRADGTMQMDVLLRPLFGVSQGQSVPYDIDGWGSGAVTLSASDSLPWTWKTSIIMAPDYQYGATMANGFHTIRMFLFGGEQDLSTYFPSVDTVSACSTNGGGGGKG